MSMEAPLGNLFLQIQERITTKVTAIQWIDQDFGQLQYNASEYKPPVNFPCVLIDITGIVFEDAGKDIQLVTGKVVIKLATAPFSNSNQKTPLPQREKALDYYKMEWEVGKVLHNWAPNGFGRLSRRTLDKQDRDDTLRERMQVYDFSYMETVNERYQKVPRPDPVIGTDIKQPN